MGTNSPGDSPRVRTLLSPRALTAYNQVETDNITNRINLDLLNEEIIQLSKHAISENDQGLLRELDALSQAVKKSNEKNSKYNNKNNFRYKESDLGPYVVIIESLNENIRDLNPLSIGKTLNNKELYSNLNIVNITRKGLKRVGVQFSSGLQANKFIEDNHFDKKYFDVHAPARYVTIAGIVRDIGIDITEEEIIEIGKGMNPECNKCLRYGHVRALCRARFRCSTCGASHEDELPCDEELRCIHCGGAHLATDRGCSEYIRQGKIREIMALHNLSLYEADHICKAKKNAPIPSEFKAPVKTGGMQEVLTTPPRKTYANIVKNNIRPSNHTNLNTGNMNKNKRKDATTGYDRIEHEQALWKYSATYPKRPYMASQRSTQSQPQLPIIVETAADIHQNPIENLLTQKSDQDAKNTRQIVTYTEGYLREGERVDAMDLSSDLSMGSLPSSKL
ncbi:hypothetical protein HHI36_001642 [Cryptolaemus montrouzieri]|uniref:Gag-like protein n=1 Tax=Cryptolaemus montrouzieri TaxID=559131 RepID=A0ABD2P877_9CUCU